MLKISYIYLKFEFQLPKYLVLELAGKHYSFSEHFLWEAMDICLNIHFSGQRLMHRLQSTIIFPKILRLKCQFDKLTETYIKLLFTHLHEFFLLKINDHP